MSVPLTVVCFPLLFLFFILCLVDLVFHVFSIGDQCPCLLLIIYVSVVNHLFYSLFSSSGLHCMLLSRLLVNLCHCFFIVSSCSWEIILNLFFSSTLHYSTISFSSAWAQWTCVMVVLSGYYRLTALFSVLLPSGGDPMLCLAVRRNTCGLVGK